MHVNAKKVALAGLLVAFSAVLVGLSSVLETNSLFFICAASFTVGIAIREWGVLFGFAFMLASTLVNVLVAPNKFHCITFAAMGVYLLFSEWLWKKLAEKEGMKHRILLLWIGKFLVFNLIYIPTLLFFQELLFTKKIVGMLLIVFFVAGQVALFIYDRVYAYFQGAIWGKMRGKL